MEIQALLNASKCVIARNVTEIVQAAKVHWNPVSSHLALVYGYKLAPSEDDLERQELAITELLAEFSDIITAECSWSISDSEVPNDGMLIYRRS